MGIPGLLRFLKPIEKVVSIPRRYRGKRIGIDMLCVLHRGALSDPAGITAGNKRAFDSVCRYVDRHIEAMTRANISVFCVFDGSQLPAKNEENRKRRESRQKAKEEADAASQRGEENYALLSKSVSISGDLIRYVIQYCVKKRWEYIIAPYEADAQLAYLCRAGIVDAVLSEDSDLLAYGCPRLLTKWKESGHAVELDLSNSWGHPGLDLQQGELSGPGLEPADSCQEMRSILNPEFGHQRFLEMCILNGCDYVSQNEHMPGLGLKTAAKVMLKHKTMEDYLNFVSKDAKSRAKIDKNELLLDDIVSAHRKALTTFKEHWVYCPIQNAVIPISDAVLYPNVGKQRFAARNLRAWNNEQNANHFKGCVLEDKENYEAATLGHCLQRSPEDWRRELYGNAALTDKLLKASASEPAALFSASQPAPAPRPKSDPMEEEWGAKPDKARPVSVFGGVGFNIGGRSNPPPRKFGKRNSKGGKPYEIPAYLIRDDMNFDGIP